jgi:transcriptional regulator with XRE-family HTH domain
VEKSVIREATCRHVVRILREKRKAAGISMETLARQAGLSQSMISFVERDLRNPTLDTLLRITGVLDIDLSRVISKAQSAARKK